MGLRADWRDEDDLFPGNPPSTTQRPPGLSDTASECAGADTGISAPQSSKEAPRKSPRMTDLIQAGMIAPGDKLRLRARPDEVATVVDGTTCEYRGAQMTYNKWERAATGWTAIQIYTYAETADGRLLQDLREELDHRR